MFEFAGLSPPQRLLGGGGGGFGEKRRCAWDDGKTESLSYLFALPSVPRALSFTLSPASKLPTRPSAKEASAEERGLRAVCPPYTLTERPIRSPDNELPMKTLQGVTFVKAKNPDRTKQTEVNKKCKIQTKNTHQNKQLESEPESFEKRCHRYYANHSSVHFFGVLRTCLS